MPYGSEFLGNIGTGLMNFAGSGLGQTAIGAGLGYGADRLAGGKGGTGAILGGVGGLMNYGSGSGGNLFGEGTSNFDSTALGGLFGSGTGQAQNQYQQQVGMIDPSYLQDPSVTGALQSGYENIPQTGLLDRASGFQKQYGGLFGGVKDIASAYGQYQTGQSSRANTKSEIDYRNRTAALNEAAFNRDFENQAATNQAAQDAFAKSNLRNYYSA